MQIFGKIRPLASLSASSLNASLGCLSRKRERGRKVRSKFAMFLGNLTAFYKVFIGNIFMEWGWLISIAEKIGIDVWNNSPKDY